MKTIKEKASRALMLATGTLAGATLYAQDKIELKTALTTANSQIKSVAGSIANLVSVIMVVVAIILLIWNFIQRAKGDAQAADKLMSFVWALLIGFLILTVLRAIAGV